jgi:NAD(P)-dependent dehydrogenase (short-subunit alcohol dehydrogenase family)
MHTILGTGGAIGVELVSELAARGRRIRLVSRNPKSYAGPDQVVSADLANLDQTIKAVAGSQVAYLLVGLKYDVRIWRELWPRIMNNVIEACKRANTKLVFFDNVYAYGRVVGPMIELTPFNPCSRKGEIRAQIASTLLNEITRGNLIALIARSSTRSNFGTGKTSQAASSRRLPASDPSPRARWWPRWATRRASRMLGKYRPGWAWCPAMTAPGAK